MNQFHRYTKLQETKLSWAPTIPAHWDIKRAKFIFKLNKRQPHETDKVVTAFRDGQVTLRENRRVDGFTNSLKEVGYQRVLKGDLVIHAMDAFAGAVGVSDSDGKCTPVYSCCTPIAEVDSTFYAHLVRSMALSGYIESLSKGIRERSTEFRWREFAEQAMPIPPITEQIEINDFLHKQSNRIDALVQQKSKFIELLQEKRLSVIASAVTRGLRPSVLLKNTGINWLGKIPKHWELLRIKNSLIEKRSYKRSDLPCGAISYGKVVEKDSDSILDETRQTYQEVLAGEYLINPINLNYDLKSLRTALSEIDVCVSPAYIVALPNKNRLHAKYGEYLLHLFDIAHMKTLGAGIRQTITFKDIGNCLWCAPPISEQTEIAIYLDKKTTQIDSLIAKTSKSIELLKEHRAALIAAAVTGKIDVRKSK